MNREVDTSMAQPETNLFGQPQKNGQGQQAETALTAASPAGSGFNLPALTEPEAVREVLEANLEGTTIQFDRVKIPSGGGTVFEVPGEDGEARATQEITGVILDHYMVNAYWAERFSGQNNPPDCSALDGKLGEGDPGGLCAKCRFNEWGSDVRQDGTQGRGKACKNLHRVYLLPEGEIFPLLIALPPTSLRNFHDYMRRLTSKLRPHFGVITRVKLQKAQNADGIGYSQAVFSRVADLPKTEAAQLKSYIADLRPLMRAVEVRAEEYTVTDGADGGDDGEDIPADIGNGGAQAAPTEHVNEPF